MSTLKTINIIHPSGSTNNIVSEYTYDPNTNVWTAPPVLVIKELEVPTTPIE